MKKRGLWALALLLTLLLGQVVARAEGETGGTCGGGITWSLDGGVLVLDGSGETWAYGVEEGYAPWFPLRDQIQSVRVEGEITALNGVLFNGCENLTELSLCASLERLVIADQYDRWPDSLVSITTAEDSVNYTAFDGVLYARSASGGEFASGNDGTRGNFCLLFYPGAKQDAAYVLQAETAAVPDGAFYRNPYLERLELNDGLARVPKLYRCTALKEVVIPDSVTSLPPSAFEGCSSLLAVDLPEGVAEIPSFAFYGCTSLTRMEIPASVTTVYTSAFWLCDALNPITIPATVRTVRGGARPGSASADLTRYKDWYFQGDVPDIQDWAGGVMAGQDGGMVPVGDRIHYWAGGQGWEAFIQNYQYYNSNGKSSPRTIFESYGTKPVLRTLVWLNGDGTVLDSASYMEGGEIPAHTAKTPEKAPADGYEFSFAHWDEGTVTEAITTYRPVFTSVQTNPYAGQNRVIYRASVTGEREERWYSPGTEITLPGNLFPVPEGKAFRAWAILGTEYQPGDRHTVTEDVYVTARWDNAPDPVPGQDPDNPDPVPGQDPDSPDPVPGQDSDSPDPVPGQDPDSPDPYPLPDPAPAAKGCYVATAVYGSYDCPQVWTLRRFRDQVLSQTWYGRLFIRAYYAVSPTAVKLFGNADWFQNFFRARLDRMTDRLQAEGYASTPYRDTDW